MPTITDIAAYLKAVKPAVARKSDKYSWLLYRFLQREKRPQDLLVLAHQLDLADNKTLVPFDKATAQPAQLFLGFLDEQGWGCGSYLSDIINPTGRLMTAAYPPPMFAHAIDVSDWFWPEYQRIGRCTWDQEHSGFMTGDEARFVHEAGHGTRVCTWCGQRQRLVTKRKSYRVHTWVKEAA